MKAEDFEIVLEKRIKSIKGVLGAKAGEYASGDDRLHNFKIAARIENVTPEKALKGMMVKHEVSIQDLIRYTEESPEKITEYLINEKIGDCINYLILLEALLKERIKLFSA